ncbi:LysR substrate-binding domain-containing protein [Devosia sp.]|uniref:LysR substrate-binding domain-containing protein n=1 Tax=Devosia sp. TaxID=1871048 RepID=UPI0035263948
MHQHPIANPQSLFPWEFEKDGQEIKVRVDGQAVFNDISMRMSSVLDGVGLAYMPVDQVQSYVDEGRLIRVLEDWSPTFTGYHLYYPNRRHHSLAFSAFVDALRYRGPAATASHGA